MPNPTFGGNVYTDFKLPIEAKVGLIDEGSSKNLYVTVSSKQSYDLRLEQVRHGYIPVQLASLADGGFFDFAAYGGTACLTIQNAQGTEIEVAAHEREDMERWQNISARSGEVVISEKLSKKLNLKVGDPFTITESWVQLDNVWLRYLARELKMTEEKVQQLYVALKPRKVKTQSRT